jgi:hypothetical protein
MTPRGLVERGTHIARLRAVAKEPHFKDAEEREISRGGKATAIWTMAIAVFIIAGGLVLALELRKVVSPPARPGTTSATTTAGNEKPPSPGASSAP